MSGSRCCTALALVSVTATVPGWSRSCRRNCSIFRKKQRSIARCRSARYGLLAWHFCAGSGPERSTYVQARRATQGRAHEKHQFFLEDHCYNCHDNSLQKGMVNLEALPLEITTLEQAELWQKVLNALNSGEMPPPDKKQPPQEDKADFLAGLADTMVVARKVLSDAGGKITMRRLNKRDYQNTIESYWVCALMKRLARRRWLRL